MAKKGRSTHGGSGAPSHVQQVQGLRGSNAAGPHPDRRTRRERDRSARERAAIRDADA